MLKIQFLEQLNQADLKSFIFVQLNVLMPFTCNMLFVFIFQNLFVIFKVKYIPNALAVIKKSNTVYLAKS
jgi:hypothetical protein